VPGAHLDGTPSTITVTTTPARQHVVIAMHDDQPAALAIAATDATSLLTLLCEGRDGMIAVVDLNARIFVIPAPAGVGPAADTGTDAGGTMLLFAATAALAPAARIPCAGRGSVAILHTSAQIDDLVEALADVLSCVEPPADP
jgi:hypothetical protein